jgi:hypothetical protein
MSFMLQENSEIPAAQTVLNNPNIESMATPTNHLLAHLPSTFSFLRNKREGEKKTIHKETNLCLHEMIMETQLKEKPFPNP